MSAKHLAMVADALRLFADGVLARVHGRPRKKRIMLKRKHPLAIDFSGVNWRLQNSEIAKSIGCHRATVGYERRRRAELRGEKTWVGMQRKWCIQCADCKRRRKWFQKVGPCPCGGRFERKRIDYANRNRYRQPRVDPKLVAAMIAAY